VKLVDGSVLLMQATVGDEHPIKGKWLLDMLNLLPEQKEYPLIFVTCEGNDMLKYRQKYLGADGKKVLKTLAGRLLRVKQYIYHMPLLAPVNPVLNTALPLLGHLVQDEEEEEEEEAVSDALEGEEESDSGEDSMEDEDERK